MVDIRTCFKARRLVYLDKKGPKQKNSDKKRKNLRKHLEVKRKSYTFALAFKNKAFQQRKNGS